MKLRKLAQLAAVAAATGGYALAGCTPAAPGQHPAPQAASCRAPARLADGSYSSSQLWGRMPSGTTVRLSDGDLYSCRNGQRVVH